ncbi:zinc-binding protein A33-like [Oryzias melastigma]|uniref:zinc-binding protein A33-like n=1 Tax=Oryzias melastigma TaxID=30732 RepID=UPI00168CED4B|nr:zinc-binding protein A33-like [Oryzias melastigma]
MKPLLESEDRLDFLQKFSALKASPPTKDWSVVPSYEGAALRAVTQLQKTIMEMIEKFLTEAKLKEAKKFAVDVTLDPQTANAFLVLSSDRKQVHSVQKKVDAPDDPKRFSHIFAILGEQSFSSGKFYFEVEVKGKLFWGLGVAEEFAERTGMISFNPENGFRTICIRKGEKLKANESQPVDVVWSVLEKVGVFVDFDEGSVAFYDVDTPAPIYTFTNNSFVKLRPFLGSFPSYGLLNLKPLTICPVNETA